MKRLNNKKIIIETILEGKPQWLRCFFKNISKWMWMKNDKKKDRKKIVLNDKN